MELDNSQVGLLVRIGNFRMSCRGAAPTALQLSHFSRLYGVPDVSKSDQWMLFQKVHEEKAPDDSDRTDDPAYNRT